MLIVVAGCDRTPPAAQAPAPTRFEDLMIDSVTALPNGDAYAVDMTGGVWLIHGTECRRVHESRRR